MNTILAHWKIALGIFVLLTLVVWGADNNIGFFVSARSLINHALATVAGGYIAIRILKKVL